MGGVMMSKFCKKCGTELNDDAKKKITEDTVNYFDNYVSPGWLKYRKSVSSIK